MALSAVVTVVAAQQYPQQKSGLWLNETTMMGHQVSTQSCVDAESQTKTSAFSAEVAKSHHCDHLQIAHNPDGSWTSVSTCEIRPGVKLTSRSDITGDFNSKFTMTMRSPANGAPNMTMTATWTGPCKPGQKPGDVILSDGTKINMLDGPPPGSAPAH